MKTFENFNKEPIPSFIFSFAIETGDDEYKSVIGIIPFLSEPEYEEDDRSDMDEKIIDACAEHNLESQPYGVHDVSGCILLSNLVVYSSTIGNRRPRFARSNGMYLFDSFLVVNILLLVWDSLLVTTKPYKNS